jgi:hypothetical protein
MIIFKCKRNSVCGLECAADVLSRQSVKSLVNTESLCKNFELKQAHATYILWIMSANTQLFSLKEACIV